MNNDAVNADSRSTRRGTLYVLGDISHRGGQQRGRAPMRGRIWLAIIVAAFFVCCAVGLVLNGNGTNAIQRPTPEQERINALEQQLSSLTQSDLIVFPDGRVWYVRAVRGNDLEVVGWIGANVRSESIDSFVLANDKITIVRRQDPVWPLQRDKYLTQ